MIGMFDSGIGGLSILRAAQKQLPQASFVYFADTAHNPYGNQSNAYVTDRALAITQQLIDQYGIQVLVIACNTATAAAASVLRARYPNLAIVGVEPALKPAVQMSKTRNIAVLATQTTLQSAKFLALKTALETTSRAVLHCVPCVGLADLIEKYTAHQVTEHDLRLACTEFLNQAGTFDTLVLGCTHYALIAPIFQSLVSHNVTIVDNSDAVARHLATIVQSLTLPCVPPALSLIGTGDPSLLQQAYDFHFRR